VSLAPLRSRPLQALRLPRLHARGIIMLIVLPLIFIAVGLYAFAQQRLHGDIVTSMRSMGNGGAAWGLYISFDIYFVGLAATGIAIATAAHLFRLRDLRPLTRICELISVLSLILAGMCVMADQGRPLAALWNLPQYARTGSPFFGSFTLIVGAGVAASLVMLYLGGRADAAWCASGAKHFKWMYRIWASGYIGTDRERRRHRRARFWLSLTIFPFIVVAYSTLGFVFGVQGGRPGWFGALRAPSMLVGAGISGIGLVLGVSGLLQRFLGARDAIPARAFMRLGNTMVILIATFIYLIAVETLTDRYAGHEAALRVSDAVIFGVFAPAFWTMLVLFVLALALVGAQFLRREVMVGTCAIAGLLANIAVLLRRFLVVVPGQTHGHSLDYAPGSYFPSWIEISVMLAVISIGVLGFVVFMRFFPIVPMNDYFRKPLPDDVEPESSGRSLTRRVLTSATLFGGLAIGAFGLTMSARYGTEVYLDPIVPFSPVIFIVGVVMTIYSAAVYVVVPFAKKPGAETPLATVASPGSQDQ